MKKFPLAALLAVLIAVGAYVPPAVAQTYPSRPVTIIVPFAAGGPTDTIARVLAQRMGPALGQTVVVENTTGAAGSIGVARVARAAPDGYTIGIGHWSTHVVNAAVYNLSYDVLNDFAPISLVANNPQLIESKNTVPAKNLAEFIAWVKANQDHITAGTAGVGSASHIGGIFFQEVTRTKFQFVPYRGTAPMMQDLLAGQIDLSFDQAANSLPQVRAGQIRAYAVTAKTRLTAAPDIPTVDEAGLPGFYVSVWHGLWAPKNTPKPVIAKLVRAVQTALADPSVQKRLAELGQELPPPDQQTPEALHDRQKAELDKWTPIIKAANIKPE
ncbi:MAG TPA: tripartite tricarboxylate transporter substrate binding protein BugD [Xanthobacteraceae bacterium]|nr:tripartite tricarboxylate transporter substrate binding protein BugD [Xanthobacteraceae bacterium]